MIQGKVSDCHFHVESLTMQRANLAEDDVADLWSGLVSSAAVLALMF